MADSNKDLLLSCIWRKIVGGVKYGEMMARVKTEVEKAAEIGEFELKQWP